MEEAPQARTGLRQKRAFVLGSLSFGHSISHLLDQGFPLLMTEIAASMSLGDFRKAILFAIRQSGSVVTSLAGGPVVDRWKRHWGYMLTGCMVWAAISYAFTGAAPNFRVMVVAVSLLSIPGSLWHLPASAAASQRFPDRRGFALSMHGFGSNIGNAVSPILTGALLVLLVWKYVFFIYAAPSLLMAVFVWWSLRDVGMDGGTDEPRGLRVRFLDALTLVKNPVVAGLIFAGLLRGIGLNALFNWTPFYLKETLGMGPFEAGVHYALLTGMGIASAPVLGALSDRLGRKTVLVPGFAVAAVLSFFVVPTGDTILLALVLAGMGLFSFALHQIIQAAVLDMVGTGTEATATGLLFGLSGVIGSVSPFLAYVIIDHLGGYGSMFYYSGILTAITAVIVMLVPLRGPSRKPTTGA